ncbi:hypothetical protein KJ632_03215 [Patescibacteria group bacterium]|nr:hypothetical protein [Patescibacteria group bacterium]
MLKISQTRIRSLKKYLPFIQGKEIVISISTNSNASKMKLVGFSSSPQEGETILPVPVGMVSGFNAEGKEKVRKDLPMEKYYRQVDWTRQQWDGYNQTKEVTDVIDRPYDRYPRDFIEPPSIELKFAQGKVVSPLLAYPKDEEVIIHTINLFLEIFGECEILNSNLEEIIKTPKNILNWEILKPGEYPWDRKEFNSALGRLSKQQLGVFKDRFTTMRSHSPDEEYVGRNGFSGYVIFCFKKKNLHICESPWHGNAIYVFQDDWRELSKKTKAEILRGGLQKERIIHYHDWKDRIDELLK